MNKPTATQSNEPAAPQLIDNLNLGFQILSGAATFKLHNRATPEQYATMLITMVTKNKQESRKQELITAINEWAKYIIKCINEYKI